MNNHFIQQSLWFTAGLGIGAGATWLLATRDGRKARRKIGHMVREGRERLNEAGQDVFERGKEMLDRGKEFVEETGAEVGRRLHFAGR
jgi:gas vesicle protein